MSTLDWNDTPRPILGSIGPSAQRSTQTFTKSATVYTSEFYEMNNVNQEVIESRIIEKKEPRDVDTNQNRRKKKTTKRNVEETEASSMIIEEISIHDNNSYTDVDGKQVKKKKKKKSRTNIE